MPLHLLGKKSWNVYNADNIARVRRDETDAKLREEEEERRLQEIDAERRLDTLRGSHRIQNVVEANVSPALETRDRYDGERRTKKRKLAGEDDTDRDIRLATVQTTTDVPSWAPKSHKHDAPLTDAKGHLDLFPQERSRAEKNEEAEKEKAKKKREYEEQYTMRFSNAAGGKDGIVNPWYSTASQTPQDTSTKDVWGNEDPMRQMREQARINSNDPLAVIKRSVKQLKEAERQRKDWKAERDRETAMPPALHHRSRRRRSRSMDDNDSLEDFSLDRTISPTKIGGSDRHRSHQKHRHHYHRRHRDRNSERDRSDHRHRSSRRQHSDIDSK